MSIAAALLNTTRQTSNHLSTTAPSYSRFDASFYTTHNSDLAGFSAEQARDHYIAHGFQEGRASCAEALREYFVDLIPKHEPVLEIGPFDTPVVRGNNVKYADVLSTDELRARAAVHGRNPETCPTIHYPIGGFLLDSIPEKFSAIVSSHTIEHQPDLVRHLQAVERRLLPDGKYFVIIPDKRYCFDHFISESTIADVMTAYFRELKVHDVGSIIEHRSLVTHNDPSLHWAGQHGRPVIEGGLAGVKAAIAEYEANPDAYIDVHAWQFTSAGFGTLIANLADLGYTKLRPINVFHTPRPRLEFCAILG
jgi:hypothetical protein